MAESIVAEYSSPTPAEGQTTRYILFTEFVRAEFSEGSVSSLANIPFNDLSGQTTSLIWKPRFTLWPDSTMYQFIVSLLLACSLFGTMIAFMMIQEGFAKKEWPDQVLIICTLLLPISCVVAWFWLRWKRRDQRTWRIVDFAPAHAGTQGLRLWADDSQFEIQEEFAEQLLLAIRTQKLYSANEN